jgi:hypothetical protein
MLDYDFLEFENNYFFNCIYMKDVENVSIPYNKHLYLIFNKISNTPFQNKTNDFISFEFEDDAKEYINNILKGKDILSIVEIPVHSLYKLIYDCNHNNGIFIKKKNTHYWFCIISFITSISQFIICYLNLSKTIK